MASCPSVGAVDEIRTRGLLRDREAGTACSPTTAEASFVSWQGLCTDYFSGIGEIRTLITSGADRVGSRYLHYPVNYRSLPDPELLRPSRFV